MNEKFIRERYVRYGKKIKNGYISDRKRILKEYNESNDPITEMQLKRYIATNNLISLLSGDKIEEEKPKPKESITRFEDGSILYNKLIQLHDNEVNNNSAFFKAFSVNEEENVLVKIDLNLWSVASKDGRLNNYQAKCIFRPKTSKDLTIDDVVNSINRVKPMKSLPYKEVKSENTYAIFLTDNHIGSSVFNDARFYHMIAKARKHIQENDVEHVHINWLGDVLHVDNKSKTTDRGTQLEMPMTATQMYDKADELIIHAIQQLAVVGTTVHWVQGNHSRSLEYGLFKGIKRKFENSKHIEFDVSDTLRKGYAIYKTFIGIMHGDMPKKNYYSWSQFEFATIWGACNRWEQHSGHYHSREVTTVGGLQHTVHGVQIDNTQYEIHLGYGNYWFKTEAYIYNKHMGRVQSFYY